MVTTTTDAWLGGVSGAYPSVERSLSLTHVLPLRLYALLGRSQLLAAYLGDGLAGFVLVYVLDGEATLGAAYGLAQALSDELLAACWVLALLWAGLFGLEAHANTSRNH